MLEQISSSKIDKIKSQVACPVELALRVLGGKWRGSVMYQLKDGPLRFSDLKWRVQDAVVDYGESDNFLSNKVLSFHLGELMDYDMVEKVESNGNTHYQLTTKGQTSIPILLDLFDWGQRHF